MIDDTTVGVMLELIQGEGGILCKIFFKYKDLKNFKREEVTFDNR